MAEIVNVVASGSLGIELDLETIACKLDNIADFNPEKYPGAYFRLRDSAPLVTLYRTGKYIITGAGSEEKVRKIRDEFLTLLSNHGILNSPADDWFRLQNFVCMEELGENLNLSALAIGLGLEVTEYEPEQFPGLVYRPSEHECVLLVFGSGKVIITGANTIQAVENVFNSLEQHISEQKHRL
jgi:transcription initiation factor TFIID TATA-box-binding protein